MAVSLLLAAGANFKAHDWATVINWPGTTAAAPEYKIPWAGLGNEVMVKLWPVIGISSGSVAVKATIVVCPAVLAMAAFILLTATGGLLCTGSKTMAGLASVKSILLKQV